MEYRSYPPPLRVKPCITAVCKHELKFIKHFRFGINTSETVIPNGIQLERIRPEMKRSRHNPFTFLAFAGRKIEKRTDILLRAALILLKEGYSIKVILVDNNKPTVAEDIFKEKQEWLETIPPREDINSLFRESDCFVSTSVHETFSYAIAEASIFGLPIIQSDIEGTMWNASNPSTFLFHSLDVSDLANAMKKVISLTDKEMTERCIITSTGNAKKYSLESWAEKITDFFESIP